MPVKEALIHDLRLRLGEAAVLTEAPDLSRYETDWSKTAPCAPLAVVRPASVEQLIVAVRACYQAGQPVVVQGGLTGLCGGATPHAGEIAISMERLSGIESVDVAAQTMTVLAGTPLEVVQKRAEEHGLMYPVDLAARGSCTIGGTLSTNAGGVKVLRYGMTRYNVLGLEAVLADGTCISSMTGMLKDNAGYDLKQLFIGSEGTLGLITRAVLRLRPRPLTRFTALCELPQLTAAVPLLQAASSAFGPNLSTFELMFPDYLQLARHTLVGLDAPLSAEHPQILIEYEGFSEAADEATFHTGLESFMERGLIKDAVVAGSGREALALWRVREAIAELMPALEPAMHFDVSAPVSSLIPMVEAINAGLDAAFDGIRRITYGHLGDGNLHVSASSGRAEDLQGIAKVVYDGVARFHGFISGEHGIGSLKAQYLGASRSPAEVALMQTLKAALDPRGILNRGRVVQAC